MRTRYLIRLDDACPTMNAAKWQRMEDILDNYGVHPIVGVIPHNEDPMQQIDEEDVGFWEKVRGWGKKGWTVALHGYNHRYTSQEGLRGLNPLWKDSEFAGLPLEEQREKIKNGMAIMQEHEVRPKLFFAPSHTFDENTLVALREASDIRVVSDTIARCPYRYKDFVFVPQQSGHPVKLPLGGFLTVCYHPNTMEERAFGELRAFLSEHHHEVVSFDDLPIGRVKSKGWFDKLMSLAYFMKRKLEQRRRG